MQSNMICPQEETEDAKGVDAAKSCTLQRPQILTAGLHWHLEAKRGNYSAQLTDATVCFLDNEDTLVEQN